MPLQWLQGKHYETTRKMSCFLGVSPHFDDYRAIFVAYMTHGTRARRNPRSRAPQASARQLLLASGVAQGVVTLPSEAQLGNDDIEFLVRRNQSVNICFIDTRHGSNQVVDAPGVD